MFKISSKDIWTYFSPFPSVSIVVLELSNACWAMVSLDYPCFFGRLLVQILSLEAQQNLDVIFWDSGILIK